MIRRPPILFIHGTSGKPAHFDAWVRYFERAGHRCAAPALPGHMPDDPAALDRLTFDDFLSASAEVAAGLDRPPVVIGYSMGGVIGQALAASTECAGLVLIASPPTGPYLPRWPLVLDGGHYLWPVLRGRAFRPSPKTLRELLLHDLAPAEQDEIVGDFGHGSGNAIRSLALGHTRVAPTEVRCPVMLVHGMRDRVVPLATATALARRLAAEFLMVPGRGHWLLADSLAETIVPYVADWIGRLPAAAAVPSFRPASEL
jgi:pimeloyl-ACP methyl ester carboxylesterase